MSVTELAYQAFYELIITSKTKDAALSKFDRNAKNLLYTDEVLAQLKTLMQPIRDERFKKRSLTDIGGIADKIEYDRADVNHNIKACKKILSDPQRKDDVLLALLLATGRRTSEVTGSTKFYKDRFVGTLKGGNDSGIANYLVPFSLIENGLKFLQKKGWRNLSPDESNRLVAVPAMRRLKVIFKGVAKVHDLRKLYIAIAIDRLKNSKHFEKLGKDKNKVLGEFINEVLGHSNPISAIPYLNSTIK
jgi:integrase